MINAAFIGRMRARLNRIWSIVGIGMGFVNIMTFAIVQKDLLGLSVPLVVGSVALVIVGLPTILVYCEERFGWWGEESRHIWELAGWNPTQLSEDIKEIKEKLERVDTI